MTTWILLRAAGIGAYVLLFLTVGWGLVGTTSVFGGRVAKATAVTIHQFLSTAALLLVGAHIGLLLVDSFMPFRWLDVLIPLHTSFRPVATAFGVLTMYAMVIVLASSWVRRRVGPTWWRRLHLLAVPAFVLAMVHGIFAGTDAVRPWMWWLYVGTGLAVLFLIIVRGLTAGVRPERHQLPAGRSAKPAARTEPAGQHAAPVERAG
jgi:DMSO/TMAO reductase YedYZ heme-binding membrane subunit